MEGEKKNLPEFKALPEPVKKESCFNRFTNAVWSIQFKKRETAKNGEMFLKTTLRNVVLYLIFLASAMIVNFGFVTLLKFYISDGLGAIFLDSPVKPNSKVTFRSGFKTHQDFWDYMQNVFTPYIHPTLWYDNTTITDQNLGYVQFQNKIMGTVRLYQYRIKSKSCKVTSQFSNLTKSCFAQFDASQVETGAYGLALNNPNGSNLTISAWSYQNGDSLVEDYMATINTYPSKGYELMFDSINDPLPYLKELKDNKWIDLQTRLVTTEFTIYNGNINLFSQIKLYIEFPASGGLLNSWSFHTVKLLRYVTLSDYLIFGAQIVFICFIVFYMIEECLDIHYNRWKYFKDVYNLLDLVIIFMSLVIIPLSFYRDYKTNEVIKTLIETGKFQSFTILILWTEIIDKTNAVILFFCWMKIFKFVSINQTMNQLNQTLGKASIELLSFAVMFTIVFTAFATCGHLLFGNLHADYRYFLVTLFTLFRIILGDFDFMGLKKVSPILGPMFFISFVFFCFFILLNMFMAIIGNSYNTVKEDNARKSPEFMLSDYLKLNYSRIVNRLNMRKNRILDYLNVVEETEKQELTTIKFDFWRSELKKKGYADTEIQTVFCKYDTDGDRLLNIKEKMKLMYDIKQARANLSKEFQDFKRTHKDNIDSDEPDAFAVSSDLPVEIDQKKVPKKERYMNHDDFTYAVDRMDKIDHTIGNIVKKIDKLFMFLELMEVEKIERRKNIVNLVSI